MRLNVEIAFRKNIPELRAEVDRLVFSNKLVEACAVLSESGWEMLYNPVDVQRFRKNRLNKILKKAIAKKDVEAIESVHEIAAEYEIVLDQFLLHDAAIVCLVKKEDCEEMYAKEVD